MKERSSTNTWSYSVAGMSTSATQTTIRESCASSIVNDGVQLTFDVTLEDAIRFRSLIDDGIFDAFNKWPDEKCPACGYTSNQAASAGDHQNCRQFPYFPGERGKSHAK